MKSQKFIFGILLLWVFVYIGCNTTAKLEANKEVVYKFVEALNNQDWDGLDNLVSYDFVRHCQATPDVQVNNLEEFIELQKGFLKSFPDQKITLEKMIAEDDYVAVLANYTGTQDGPMQPFPPSGKKLNLSYISFLRFDKGKIVEMWVEWDNMAALTQLGHFPPPEAAAK
jgi:steroid delta-isomerase-like uncharacterized protein